MFAVNARLHTPLFPHGEMPYRDSIEGGYSTAYCGVPRQSTYLPAPLESYVAAMEDASRPRPAVECGKMGLMVVRAELGESAKIRLHFGGTVEQRAMAGASALAWIASLVALWRNRRERTVETA